MIHLVTETAKVLGFVLVMILLTMLILVIIDAIGTARSNLRSPNEFK